MNRLRAKQNGVRAAVNPRLARPPLDENDARDQVVLQLFGGPLRPGWQNTTPALRLWFRQTGRLSGHVFVQARGPQPG